MPMSNIRISVVKMWRVIPMVIPIAFPRTEDVSIDEDHECGKKIELRTKRRNDHARNPDRSFGIPELAGPDIVIKSAIRKIVIVNSADVVIRRRPRWRDIISIDRHRVVQCIDEGILRTRLECKRRTKE